MSFQQNEDDLDLITRSVIRRRSVSSSDMSSWILSKEEVLHFVVNMHGGWVVHTSDPQLLYGVQWFLCVAKTNRDPVDAVRFQLQCRGYTNPIEQDDNDFDGQQVSVQFEYQVATSSPSWLWPCSPRQNVHFTGKRGEAARGDFYWVTEERGSLNDHVDNEGNLKVDVAIHLCRKLWYPKPDVHKAWNHFKGLYKDLSAESDISFLVGEYEVKFFAHRVVLRLRAPELYKLIEGVPHGKSMQIPGTTSYIFGRMIDYIYLGDLPKFDIDDEYDYPEISVFAEQLLEAADRYGLITLKLHLESEISAMLVASFNAAAWLCSAEKYTCPLLKEWCFEACALDIIKVRSTPAWNDVKKSPDLLEELSVFLAHRANRGERDYKRDDRETWSVSHLRGCLEERKLDVDGTRSMLIRRLNDHDKAKKEESDQEEKEPGN